MPSRCSCPRTPAQPGIRCLAVTANSTRPTTIDDVALVFEGGGMRGTHTAGFVTTLLEEGLDFPDVSGISAGSSHTVNHVACQHDRARDSFVELTPCPRGGGTPRRSGSCPR